MKQYLDLLQKLIDHGHEIPGNQVRAKIQSGDVGKKSLFGEQLRFDLSQGFPLLTTKKMFTKAIIHELVWFLRGDTNIRYLVDNGIGIWTDWPYKKFVENRKMMQKHYDDLDIPTKKEFEENIKAHDNFARVWGDCGPIYGKQWRKWSLSTSEEHTSDTESTHIDQITNVIESLKNNPHGTRHIVTAWNPAEIEHMALPPCHTIFQFYARRLSQEERLDLLKRRGITEIGARYAHIEHQLDFCNIPTHGLQCQLYQRSADAFLGVPFNIASYALLVHIIAQLVNMKPDMFIHTFGDVHYYTNHLEQIEEQLTRLPMPRPKVSINPELKSIDDIQYSDIQILGYQSHPPIKGEVAV